LAVAPEGGAAVHAGAAANDEPAPDLSAVAWTDADIGRFAAVRGRLLRWGWPEVESEALADGIVRARRDGDDRRTCAECAHLRAGRRCGNARAAGLVPELPRELVTLLQRCPGFAQGGT
jgi:hypothetical protein